MARNRRHTPRPSAHLLALLAMAVPAAGIAQTAGSNTLPAVTVKESADVPFKADTSANEKFTAPLVDTPKTVQIIRKEVIEEQGAVSLMEALRNTPGITMQMGENGNTAAGDTFQLRGSSMQQSTFVDGIRDLGAVTRDTFNLEQIEVVKGAGGADTGRGAGTGYLNLVTKQAHLGDENSASVTVGTGSRKRATVDLNKQLGDSSALRVNGMLQDSGVDGRDFVENKGAGLGLAYSAGLGTPTRVHLYSQHIRQDNVPDGGVPTIGMPGYYHATAQVRNAPRVNRENFYGSVSDYEKVDADMITAKVEHDLGEKTTLRNITRWGRSELDRRMTGIATNNNLVIPNPNDPSTWEAPRSRQGVGTNSAVEQHNTILANQTSVRTEFAGPGGQHTLIAGVELMREEQEVFLGTATGTTPNANLYNPDPLQPMATLSANGGVNRGHTNTLALYALDNIEFNERWSLNGGLRVDHYRLKTRNLAAGGAAADPLSDKGTLVSWSVGGVYKPADNGSVYLSYADSKTPPGGDNFQLSAAETNQANAAFDPQVTRTVELGTKWELLDKRLNVAAAIFRSVNENQISYDLGSTVPQQITKKQVDGIELSAVGQITRQWQVTAAMAKTDVKQKNQRTSAGVATSFASWDPDFSATFWTSYLIDRLTLGVGARYMSKLTRAQINDNTTVATTNMVNVPSYTVVDAMIGYRINDKVDLRLNLYNLFDKEYAVTVNNAGNRMLLGVPRSAALTANIRF